MDDQSFLKENGFVVKRNFFSSKELDDLVKLNKSLHTKGNSKYIQLHNNKNTWDLITNKKILDNARKLTGENIYYLFHSSSVLQGTRANVDSAWHRDNVCRKFGLGPDWKGYYNVLRVAIYMDNGSKSGLNFIKKTHRSKGYICKFLNFVRNKHKRIYHNRIFRFIFDNLVGTKIYTKAGDCIFFNANVYHSAMNNDYQDNVMERKAFFITYGTNNEHAKNFMNYYLYHREDLFNIDEEIKEELYKALEQKEIKINPPTQKQNIDHASL